MKNYWSIALSILLMSVGIHSQGKVSLPDYLAESTAEVTPVKVGLSYSEGPVIDSLGNIFFSENPDVPDGRIWRIDTGGNDSIFYDKANHSNGLEFDTEGRLVSCQKGRIVRWGKTGKATFISESGKKGVPELARANDLSIGSDGSMFITNLNGNDVFYRSPDGKFKTFSGFKGPNGIEWIEEKNIIYISHNKKLDRCDVDENRDIKNCTKLASISGPDGLTTDTLGNIYQANWSTGKITVHDTTGKKIGEIEIHAKEVDGKRFSKGMKGNASNCIFGGPEGKTLYITGDGGLYKVELKAKGRVPDWRKRKDPVTIVHPGINFSSQVTYLRYSQLRVLQRRSENLELFSITGKTLFIHEVIYRSSYPEIIILRQNGQAFPVLLQD